MGPVNTRPRRELRVTQHNLCLRLSQWQQLTQGPRALGVSRTRVGIPLPNQHTPPSNIPGEDKYKSSIHAGTGLQPDDEREAGGWLASPPSPTRWFLPQLLSTAWDPETAAGVRG